MPERKRMLKRLATLYGVVEGAQFEEMRRRLMLLDEAEQAIAAQESMIWTTQEAGRGALKQNDLLGWKQAGTQTALARWSNEQLEMIREERNELYEAAKERYRTSRLQSEQMSQLLEDATRELDEVERRRGQSMADDRYLSRKRWMQMRTRSLGEGAKKNK